MPDTDETATSWWNSTITVTRAQIVVAAATWILLDLITITARHLL